MADSQFAIGYRLLIILFPPNRRLIPEPLVERELDLTDL